MVQVLDLPMAKVKALQLVRDRVLDVAINKALDRVPEFVTVPALVTKQLV
jgi:hypothetical protein